MSTSAIYSCLKCRKHVKSFEELSSSQQLCKSCRGKYPLLTCKFCRSDFHYMSKTALGDTDPVCTKCSEYYSRFGAPKVCTYCNLLAAFRGELCHRCHASEKKYGHPVMCQQCRVKCAFNKPNESRQKVGDQVLCFVCTVAYKKAQHRSIKRKSENQSNGRDSLTMPIVTTVQVASGTTTITAAVTASEPTVGSTPPQHSTLVPPPKKRKFTNGSALPSPVTTAAPTTFGNIATSGQASSTGTTPSRIADSRAAMAFSSHMSDSTLGTFEVVNTLTEKAAALQKQVKDRDQQLMEKDKKATEFKAEVRETEKSLRTKLASLQKQLETSQGECCALRRQITQLSKAAPKNTSKARALRNRVPCSADNLFESVIVKREPTAVKETQQTGNGAEKVASPFSGVHSPGDVKTAGSLSSSDID